MSSNSKPRQPRLRASCDGCFLAKVKCSKARPVCSRCIQSGLDCRYSPSSRAGKPKADHSATAQSPKNLLDVGDLSPLSDCKDLPFSTIAPSGHGIYKMDGGGWNTPASLDGSMSRNPSVSGGGVPMMGVDERHPQDFDAPADMYGAVMPWTPPSDYPAAGYGDLAIATSMPLHHGRSNSLDHPLSAGLASPWTDSGAADMMGYPSQGSLPTPSSMGSNYFPSPSPTLRSMNPRIRSASASGPVRSSCTCFKVCLQSLHELHEAVSPPFDLVLKLNANAVEGCAAMLACPKCMGRSDNHTAAMLLATVIGKITTFYKEASRAYFEGGAAPTTVAPTQPAHHHHHHNHDPNGLGLGVRLGEYTLAGEDSQWLELEFLARELRKLEELYRQFCEACGELSGGGEIGRAMVGYLGQNLGSTLEVVSHRQGVGQQQRADLGYV